MDEETRAEEVAGEEAAAIGGTGPEYGTDESHRPLTESGAGEREGFEEAERELVDHASHAENRYSPRRDAFSGEADPEAVDDDGRFADADEIETTERPSGDQS